MGTHSNLAAPKGYAGMSLLILPLLAASSAAAAPPPPELEQMWAYRREIGTGELTLHCNSHKAARERTQRVRFAADDAIFEHLPDSEGKVLGRIPGKQSSGERRRQFTMMEQGRRWEYGYAAPVMALVFANQNGGPTNVRALGAMPYPAVGVVAELRPQALNTRAERYQVQRESNDRLIVRAYRDAEVMEWILDPQREMQPTAVRSYRDGALVAEARTEYSLLDNIWYPIKVEYFNSTYAAGAAPIETLQLSEIRLNQPDQPKRLTPEDMGVEPGVNIELRNGAPNAPSEAMMWSGTEIVSQEEFSEMAQSGAVQHGPGFSAAARRQPARARTAETAARPSAPANHPDVVGGRLSEWERYTKEFIEKYKLDDAQSQRAMKILTDCQARANTYVSRRREELASVDRELRLRPQPTASASLNERLQKLLAPIDSIFEEQLKPRLDKLPTRAQREGLQSIGRP